MSRTSIDISSEPLARFPFERARRALLTWFETNGRAFPWRDAPTPYRVWISEIMLQQTTTQTVAPYFERFLARFPNVESLARAELDDVLALWEGLGYYRRARALHEAAQTICERFGGVFPSEYDDVFSLPGVGRYASGAILSFGFDKRFPILEANTTRLHARLLALREETTCASSQKTLWDFAERWLPKESPRRSAGLYRRLNGALTDLGRLICAPTEPRCALCPLDAFCEARRLGVQAETPVLKKKKETIGRVDVALWITRADLRDAANVREWDERVSKKESDVLLVLRPNGALWAGLWDFPRFDFVANSDDARRNFRDDAALNDRVQYFLEEEAGAPGADYRACEVATTVRHSVTRYRVTLRLCRLSRGQTVAPSLFDALERPNDASFPNVSNARKASELRQAAELRWTPVERLASIPLSSPGRKLANYIAAASK